jgi:hypothetical protein
MILNAVHEKLSAQERRFNTRLAKMEERFAKRLDALTKTLDKFLKRLSDIEEEFIFMKADLNRVKAVLQEETRGRAGLSHDCRTRCQRPRLTRSFFACRLSASNLKVQGSPFPRTPPWF